MRPIAIDEVAWSIGLSVDLSVKTVSPAKTAEPIDAVWDVNSSGPKELSIRWGPDPPWEEIFWGMTTGFSACRREPLSVPSGPDVGTCPHAVDERSDWLAVCRSNRVSLNK